MVKLYRVSARIYASEPKEEKNEQPIINIVVTPYEAVEKGKTFVFYDGTSQRKLKKEKLGIIDTKLLENLYNRIGYYTYCLEEQIEAMIGVLQDTIYEEINKRVMVSDALYRAMTQPPVVTYKEEEEND